LKMKMESSEISLILFSLLLLTNLVVSCHGYYGWEKRLTFKGSKDRTSYFTIKGDKFKIVWEAKGKYTGAINLSYLLVKVYYEDDTEVASVLVHTGEGRKSGSREVNRGDGKYRIEIYAFSLESYKIIIYDYVEMSRSDGIPGFPWEGIVIGVIFAVTVLVFQRKSWLELADD